MDPVIHAKMTQLVQEENNLEDELKKLKTKEIDLWKGRVKLAREKGMDELAEQAKERVRELLARENEIENRLEIIKTQKKNLRYESRRPTGREVERAEAMVEQARLGGLVDPDGASLERQIDELEKENVSLDFGDED